MLVDGEVGSQLLLQVELKTTTDHDARHGDQRHLVGQGHEPHGLHVVCVHDDYRLRAKLLRIDHLDAEGTSTAT